MADNVTQKSPKSASDKSKFSNVIHRTTSETLRLGETDAIINNSGLLPANSQRKKPCSFQITSVIVGRMTNDGGDDSADDLDESHADDISDVIDNSRITDNETPSYSEDTYSKEDIFFNVSSSSLCSAPVIPTSSQYGLAIVSPGSAGINNTILNSNSNCVSSSGGVNSAGLGACAVVGPISALDVNVTVLNPSSVVLENAVNSTKLHEPEVKDMQSNPSRNDRFKVVKIESTEPFKRGRWSCMDFLDSANQQYAQLQQQQQQQQQQQHHQQQQQQTSRVESSLNVSVQYLTNDSTMSDFRNDQTGPNQQNVSTGSNIQQLQQQQHTQSLPPQQLQQNIVQPNVHIPQSQNQYYQPQHVQGQSNVSHMPSGQQYSQSNTSVQQSIQQQYPVQQQAQPQQQQQMGMQGMMVQSGAYGIPQQNSVPIQQATIQQVSQNVVQGSQTQISQMGMVQAQVMGQQNIVQQPQVATSSSVVSQVPYNQQSNSNFTPTSSSVMPSQYVAQGQTFSSQSSHTMIPQQSVGQIYSSQPVATNLPAQGQSYAGNQPQQNIQSQSYSNQASQQIVNSSLPAQGQSYAGQLSQAITTNVPTQGQSYSGHSTQSTTGNVSTQGQSYTGQAAQMVGNIPAAQGQSYSGQPPIPNSMVASQGQSFASQQTQTQSYAQQPVIQQQQQPSQGYVQQSQPQQQQQSGVQSQGQGQSFPVSQSQNQAYVSQQQQGSYPGVAQSQVYSQNVAGPTSVPQSQSYVVSMPSSPASVPQQPVYPAPSQGASSEPPQGYTQSQNYVPTSATGSQPQHLISNVGNYANSQASYSSAGLLQQSTYSGSQQNMNMQQNYSQMNVPTHTPSSSYNNHQFKGQTSTAQGDGPSPSEMPTAAHPDTTAETPNNPEETQSTLDDADSAAGNSAVAIDNKIEQAMDLVKSHLMFAVREEVEVLKEKIAELMDRINQLETENSILKANASQETLAQLSAPASAGMHQPPPSQNMSPGGGAGSSS